jgi:RNA polymerase sigma-70 factor (ECF subfamily)
MSAHPDSVVAELEQLRPYLFALAYRMLASAADAEDVVQDAFLRCRDRSLSDMESPRAFMGSVVTRLCLNQLRSARRRREQYVGAWLPEPVASEPEGLPPALQETLSLAFLVLLEQLSPLERAVFLLHEVFDYEHAEIASMVGRGEAACRQLLSRARRHVAENRPRFTSSPEAKRSLMTEFARCVSEGELAGLLKLLTDDVVLTADGGGKFAGALHDPLQGRVAVARFLINSPRLVPVAFTVEAAEVNAELALVLRAGPTVLVVIALEWRSEKVCAIRAVANPDKLRWLNRTSAGL